MSGQGESSERLDPASSLFLQRSVVAVRWLLGVQCLLSGLNWWFKILPFPNIFDPPGMPVKSAIVHTMIESGWMFDAAKAIEVALGLALILNRFVPLMLVVSMPVILMTFLLDAWIFDALFGWLRGEVPFTIFFAKFLDMVFFGGCVLVMQIFLMLAYLDLYRPMLAYRTRPNI